MHAWVSCNVCAQKARGHKKAEAGGGRYCTMPCHRDVILLQVVMLQDHVIVRCQMSVYCVVRYLSHDAICIALCVQSCQPRWL